MLGAKTMTFSDKDAVLCPECFQRPESATLEISPGREYADPEFPFSFKNPDKIEGIELSCGHKFQHYMYFIYELQHPQSERVLVWNFR